MIPYLVALLLILYGVYTYDIRKETKFKRRTYYGIMFFLIILSGFSYRLGGDGLTYLEEFRYYTTNDGFGWTALNKYTNRMPGWVFLVKVCKSICPGYWFFKLVHATIVNFLFFRGIRQITTYYSYSGILFYFCLIFFDYNFQVLRQSLAVGIFLNSYSSIVFERTDPVREALFSEMQLLKI